MQAGYRQRVAIDGHCRSLSNLGRPREVKFVTDPGGDAGSAVSTAFRNAEFDVGGEGFTDENGDETRRRDVCSDVGDGGEAPCACLGGLRAVVLDTALELVDRESVPVESILDLGGDARDTGDEARIAPVELLVDNEGEVGRLVGGEVARMVCDVEVA